MRPESEPGRLPVKATPRGTRTERGSTLIVTVVLLAVLTIVAAGLVQRSETALESVNAVRHYDSSVSCADGARELLLSQFRAFNVDPASLSLDTTIGNRRLVSGHYDQFGVKSVRPLAGAGAIAQNSVMGMANKSAAVSLGGAPYVFTVVCTDSTGVGRQTEVEFLIRFGI